MKFSFLVICTLLFVITLPAMGASSFLGGYSGNIFSPDGVVVPNGTWELSYHDTLDILGDTDLKAFGVTYGLIPNLEVGASFLDNGESDIAINAKYAIVPETATRPAVLVGVFDAFGSAGFLDPDPSLYVAFSKNITPLATDIAGEPSKPLRLSVGFGTNLFDGLFAGLDWTLNPRFSLMAEYFGGDIGGDDSSFNVGARYALTDALRVDAATIDFQDFGFGVSARTSF